jgi:hypothetical protein
MITKKNKNVNVLQIRDDIVLNVNNIDVILKTNLNPKDNAHLKEDMYVIYLNNSKYSYIMITQEEFNTYIKPKL